MKLLGVFDSKKSLAPCLKKYKNVSFWSLGHMTAAISESYTLRDWALDVSISVPRMGLSHIQPPKSFLGLGELKALADAFIAKVQSQG